MIKRLFSVVITVSLAVSSLGAMERPNKPNKSSGNLDARRARIQQRRQQRGQQPAPAPAPQRPVNQNRPAKAKAKAKQAKNQGQQRPQVPFNYNCQPPQNQRYEHQAEDESSSCDCSSCEDDSSEENLPNSNAFFPHDFDERLNALSRGVQVLGQMVDRYEAARERGNNNPSIQLRTGSNNNNNNIESPRQQEARPANQPVANRTVEGECTICTEALQGDPVAIVPCNHNFHRHCIERWRRTGRDQADNCPLCRAEITRLQPVGK